MRLAIISTPRSENTWFRYILSNLYGLEQYAIHRPNDLDWGTLPENCVVQIHWHKSLEISTLLESHGFQVLTIARHPLDVLISILHFSMFEPQTACWLDGEGGATNHRFLTYCRRVLKFIYMRQDLRGYELRRNCGELHKIRLSKNTGYFYVETTICCENLQGRVFSFL